MLKGTVSCLERVIIKFGKAPPKARLFLRVAMVRLGLMLETKIKSEKLSGQVLNRRTSTLFRSIAFRMIETAASVAVRVFTILRYGRAHEFGFKGIVPVPAHGRTVSQVFGRSIPPKLVFVSAHMRKVTLPVRSFARSSLGEMKRDGVITQEIKKAVREGNT
jgi:hypothetical protein